MSPLAENAEKNSRIKAIFHETTYPVEGIFALNLYIRGRPMTITIDDYLPFYNGNLIFDNQASSGSGDMNIWAALLEKAFAKINGNYEAINEGW